MGVSEKTEERKKQIYYLYLIFITIFPEMNKCVNCRKCLILKFPMVLERALCDSCSFGMPTSQSV